jgi:hypothetical protein
MSRRVSSRDDLFLSALDMYTLLSLMFVGVAFMASYGTEERSILDLPRVPSEARTEPEPKHAEEAIFVHFPPSGDAQSIDAECHLAVIRPGGFTIARGARISVPCWPRAFAGRSTPSEVLLKLARVWREEHPDRMPEAIIACREDDITGCARLQWTMAEHGFRPHALVRHD